jgi:hypothetical protein
MKATPANAGVRAEPSSGASALLICIGFKKNEGIRYRLEQTTVVTDGAGNRACSYVGGASAHTAAPPSPSAVRELKLDDSVDPARPISVRMVRARSPLRTDRSVALLVVDTKGSCPLQGRTNDGCDGE